MVSKALRHRRILVAQLDGATRRNQAMRIAGKHAEADSHQTLVDRLSAELEAHDQQHGPPPPPRQGGLWGHTGPTQPDGRLYSTGPSSATDQR